VDRAGCTVELGTRPRRTERRRLPFGGQPIRG
jgi:hypothetical protein